MATSYSLNAWIAGYTALLGEITGGAGDATVSIFDDDDVLLAEATIDATASEVSATTGDITIEIDTQEDSAPAGGTASYAQIINGDAEPTIQVPCQAGSSPVAGYCVLNTLTIVSGAPVEILSVTIPAGTILSLS
jgi:hypothetical protein